MLSSTEIDMMHGVLNSLYGSIDIKHNTTTLNSINTINSDNSEIEMTNIMTQVPPFLDSSQVNQNDEIKSDTNKS